MKYKECDFIYWFECIFTHNTEDGQPDGRTAVGLKNIRSKGEAPDKGGFEVYRLYLFNNNIIY